MRSMTGFGAAAIDTPALQATATVRSLNHRFLDLSVHLPRSLNALEPEVKDLVQRHVTRGKVDVSLHATFVEEAGAVRVLTHPYAGEVVQALRRLRDEHSLGGEVTVADVTRLGVIEVAEMPTEFTGEKKESVLGVLKQALAELSRMREDEGRNLTADLTGRLATIEELSLRIDKLMEESRATRVAALKEKIQTLAAELGLEEARFYQEVVRLVDRQDTSEETTRLRSHVAQARTFLRAPESVGKRLDFLAQELTREANTIGSKAASAPVIQEVVALKAEIEKLREQVQNVE